jgi:hypothetical protein
MCAPESTGTAGRCSLLYSFRKAIDEVARLPPDAGPILQNCPAFFGDSVVAPGWSRIRGHDAAGQKAVRAECSKHGVHRAFLEQSFPLIGLLEPLGNLVAIEVFRGLVQDGQQHQGDQTCIEVFLKLARMGIVHWPILLAY